MMKTFTIAIRDRAEMKWMGKQYRAWFVNPLGVPFHKDFMTSEEMDAFIDKARAVGTKLVGFMSI